MLDIEVKQNSHLCSPTSVFDARTGLWQNRKKWWISLGIKSEEGRGDNASGFSDTCRGKKKKDFINGVLFSSDSGSDPKFYDKKVAAENRLGRKLSTAEFQKNHYTHIDANSALASGTSIFDPVLCEHLYTWFCPKGGRIVDPFAGGSVRGVVASVLGRKYWGCDLRPEQIKSNQEQAKKICPGSLKNGLEWVTGDSRETLAKAPEADLVFSCPPYGDLEKYGNDPHDLANMSADDFDEVHGEIIKKACDRLKNNRFACWIISEYRVKDGTYAGFVPNTIWWFEKAGLKFYNEAILINPMGSLQIRMGKQFNVTKKLGRTHQNIVIFVKGDPRIASTAINESEAQ